MLFMFDDEDFKETTVQPPLPPPIFLTDEKSVTNTEAFSSINRNKRVYARSV
jgi:hypothetical protein